MPPLTTYNTPAASCPAIQVPAVLPNPLAPAAVPKTLPSFSEMLPSAFIPNLQQFALAVEALAERGGGIYALLSGFALTDGGGLNVRVGDGAAAIGGYVSKFTPTTGYQVAALTNSATNRVWIGQAGQVNVNTSTTSPAGAWAYAGAVVVAGGVITSFDLSGVMTLPIGGRPERRTGDTGMPADTPPAGVRFDNYSNGDGSVWRWNGTAYIQQPSTALDLLRFSTVPTRTHANTADTILLADAGGRVKTTNAAAITETLPPHSAVAFPTNTIVAFNQSGAGQITIAAGAGVTLHGPGAKVKSNVQYSTIFAVYEGSDVWTLSGDLI